jgi:two-component system OmpR family sensor kinase
MAARRLAPPLRRLWGALPAPLRRALAPTSLRGQLLARSLWILAGLLALIGAVQYAWMSRFIYENTAQTIRSQVFSTPSEVWISLVRHPAGRDPGRAFPFSLTMPGTSVAFVDAAGDFYDLTGLVGGHESPQLSPQAYVQALTQGVGAGAYDIVTSPEGYRALLVLVPVGPPGQPFGVVQVAADISPLRHVLMQQLVAFLCLAAASLMLGFVVLRSTLRRTLVPLSNMVDTVQRIGVSNLDERVRAEGAQDEVATLAHSFNQMLDRLEAAFAAERAAHERMRKFVADASHELRTPLTAIHGFLEVLLRGAARQPDQLQQALESMYGESERLTKLVQGLLTLARLDREPAPDLKPDRIDEVVGELLPQLRLLAEDRTLDVRLPGPITARIDRDQIKQVVLNLVQNAVQHTDPAEGRIELSLEESDDAVILRVADNGTGIPPEHLPHIFERFYRVDKARSRRHGGAGLGLAITQSIVHAHGGTIQCESEVGCGTAFTVRLPRPKTADSPG